MAFLKGYGFGLATIVFIGPVLFTLLDATLQKGWKAGFGVAFGIFLSDVVAAALCLLVGRKFFEDTSNMFYIGLAGASLLLAFGLKYLIKPPDVFEEGVSIKSSDYLGYFTSGFFINFVNPFVFAFWIGFIAAGRAQYEFGLPLYVFISGILAGILTLDVLRTILATYIKRWMKPNLMLWVYRGIGIFLIIAALVLLGRVSIAYFS